ncbi:hypothetical protein CDD83_2966 [Cordyceps sp. RAO-2017]|nr:hypothetical protein CDD83_2966 [Cordyceps sp. RAO-2017]
MAEAAAQIRLRRMTNEETKRGNLAVLASRLQRSPVIRVPIFQEPLYDGDVAIAGRKLEKRGARFVVTSHSSGFEKKAQDLVMAVLRCVL